MKNFDVGEVLAGAAANAKQPLQRAILPAARRAFWGAEEAEEIYARRGGLTFLSDKGLI